jgi:hypothetical protein
MSNSNDGNNGPPEFLGDEVNTTHPEYEGPIDAKHRESLGLIPEITKNEKPLNIRPSFFGSPSGKSILTQNKSEFQRKPRVQTPALDRFKRLLELLKKLDEIK